MIDQNTGLDDGQPDNSGGSVYNFPPVPDGNVPQPGDGNIVGNLTALVTAIGSAASRVSSGAATVIRSVNAPNVTVTPSATFLGLSAGMAGVALILTIIVVVAVKRS